MVCFDRLNKPMIPSFRSPAGRPAGSQRAATRLAHIYVTPGVGGNGRGCSGGDFRDSFFGGDRKAQVKQHVDALVADLGIEQDQIAEVALRYVLSQDAVSTVIAGMRTVRNVERNAAVGDGRGLSAGQRAIVARHRWERNFYES